MHFLLIYEVAAGYVEQRAQHRAAHLALAWQAVGRGELVLGGTVGNPVEGGLLLFRGDGPDAAEAFARVDPYVVHGQVTRWRVAPWNTMVGADAAHPLRLG